jgi:DNA-directed RNA polymerase specialized sigma24 family protein
MMNRGKTDDITLVRQCIAREGNAWSEFFRRFHPVITGRINQIFFRHGFTASTADQQDAFDAVVDHLLYGKGLKGFSRDDSLEAYIRTITTHAVIDWYRKRNVAKNLHGATVNTVLDGDPGTHQDSDESPDVAKDTQGSQFEGLELTEPERLMLCVLLCRTRDIADRDLDAVATLAGKTRHACEADMSNLRDVLNERWDANQEKYESLQRLWVQMTVLERRGDKERYERRKSQYDKQLADYRKKGIEPFPTRKEIATMLNWDVNKVDRIYRKLEESLSRQKTMNPARTKTPMAC